MSCLFFAWPLMLLLGIFPTWQACFCWSVGPHILFTILVTFMALVYFTLRFHFTIWVYNPFLTIPAFRGKCPMHSVLWWSVRLINVSFLWCDFSTLIWWTWRFYVTSCSLTFLTNMIFLFQLVFRLYKLKLIPVIISHYYLICSSENGFQDLVLASETWLLSGCRFFSRQYWFVRNVNRYDLLLFLLSPCRFRNLFLLSYAPLLWIPFVSYAS